MEALRPPGKKKQNARMRKKNKTRPVFVFPVVALLPGPTRGAGRMGWRVGGGGCERTGQSSPDSALLAG